MATISDDDLARVNLERDKLELPPLSSKEARDILFNRSYSGDDPAGFLISLARGGSGAMTTGNAGGLVPGRRLT